MSAILLVAIIVLAAVAIAALAWGPRLVERGTHPGIKRSDDDDPVGGR